MRLQMDRILHPWMLAMVLCCNAPQALNAQFNPRFLGPQEPVDPAFEFIRRLPSDAITRTTYARAMQALNNGDVSSALESFQSLLDDAGDFFLNNGKELTGSLLRKVESSISEHQDDYERLYGQQAQQLYEQAKSEQDLDLLRDVVRRFRLTSAGKSAVKLLNELKLDQGFPELAVRSETFVQQKLGEISAPAESLLYDWNVPFGNVSHSSRSSFSPAMLPDAWSQPLVDEYDFFLGDLEKEERWRRDSMSLAKTTEAKFLAKTDRVEFPAGRALIVGDRVIVPGFATTKSYRLENGELDGVGVNIDQTFEYLHEFASSKTMNHDQYAEEMRGSYFALRGWRDLTAASVSSDGKYVYAVSNCQIVGGTMDAYLASSVNRHELIPQNFNQLHAFELNAGLRNRWSVGTVDDSTILFVDEENDQVQREIFFYGAPLPVGGQLFVIGEERGQVQLYELERETGHVKWSIGLLNPDMRIALDQTRRMSGIMPSLVNGLLICPTGEGVITAVDPVMHHVVWSHMYEVPTSNRNASQFFRRPRNESVRMRIDRLLDDDRWFDSKVVCVGNFVLHTPPDTDKLVCLNAEDGTPAWEDEYLRLRSLYLAGAFADTVVLVGKSEIIGLNVTDASRVWSCPIPSPSGRGVRMGDYFFQPLISGEIAVVDLKTGRQRFRIPLEENQILGNLTAAHGRLIAQSGTEVMAFDSFADVEERLAGTTDETERQFLKNEIAMQQGEIAQAVEEIESIDGPELPMRMKSMLAWVKLDSLSNDFEANRDELEKIESYLTTHEQQFRFLRATANGLRDSGDFKGAFAQYLKLFEKLSQSETIRDMDGVREVRDSIWSLAEIQDLWNSANDDVRSQFQQSFDQWIEASSNHDAILSFVRLFPNPIATPEVVLRRLQSVPREKNYVGELSAVYLQLTEVSELSVQAAAYQQLAELALLGGDGGSALTYLSRLRELHVTPLLADSPAPEIATSIRDADRWSEEFNAVPVWPAEVKESNQTEKFAKSPRYQIPMIGPPSMQLAGWTFFVNQGGSLIDVYDEHGRRVCQHPTGIPSSRFMIGRSLALHVCVQNHLALIVLADRFLVLDFQEDREHPRDVFRQMLISPEQDPFFGRGIISPDQQLQFGVRTYRNLYSRALAGSVSAISSTTICYAKGSELTAIDALTGKTLWKRFDLLPDSEIFIDDDYVLTLKPGSDTLHVYRALDGTKIGLRAIPEGAVSLVTQRHNSDWGRYIPVIQKTETTFTFSLYDPVNEETLWEFTGPAGTIWTTADQQHPVFLAPDGQLTIINTESGRRLFEKVVPVAEPPKSLMVLTYANQWVVLPGNGNPLRFDFAADSTVARSLEKSVHGTIVAIDKTDGEVQWSYDIENQKTISQFPNQWPILFFGNGIGEEVKGVVLNRITGKEVVNDSWESDRTWIHWQASIQPRQLRIGYGRKTVNLEIVEPLQENE